MNFPLVIDCIGLSLEGNRLKGIRSVYRGIEAPITGEDFAQAEIIIAVGHGIGGPEHIPTKTPEPPSSALPIMALWTIFRM
jgi:hypothetical protein